MSVTNRLVYDPTDSETIAASSSIGSYILAGDDGTAIGHVGDALKVDIGSVSDLDIRDLDFNSDSVTAHQGGTWTVGVSGDVNVTQGTSPWVVSATDLDIRDLSAAQDSVASHLFDGAGTALTSTLVGSDQALDVNIVNEIDVEDDKANTAIENTAKSVTTSSSALLSSELADRRFLYVQNLGNKHCYIGKSGVTSANGIQLFPKALYEYRLGPAVSMHAVSAAGSQDVRIMELS